MDNEMKLTVKALSQNEAFVRNAVAAFCVGLDPTLDQLSDIKTAVSEAVTNCVVHAYPNGNDDNYINIETKIIRDTVHIVISDFGVGIDDITHAMQPFFTTKPNEERSGMGFTVMDSFMDELTVKNNEPVGTVVSMKKTIRGDGWNAKKHCE